jgi:uncharacterized membrane protein YfcA
MESLTGLISLELLGIALASLLAGFVDAIVGGGGLILLPSLFAAFPTAPAATLLGTNKGGAIWGTALAAWQYSRKIEIAWRVAAPAMATAWLGSACGAWVITHVDPQDLKRALPVLLAAVLAYTLWRKDLGQTHQPRFAPRREAGIAAAIGGVIGFYDGIFGPGTGSFLVFALVRILGWDFLHASATAKLINTATNAAALLLFAWTGNLWWGTAAVLAVTNMVGSLAGTAVALRHGSGLIRRVFIGVVFLLICKTGYDAWRL